MLRTSYFVRMASIGRKPIKNFGISSRGRSQGLRKFSGHSYIGAHRAVIFATAQLSCISLARAEERLR